MEYLDLTEKFLDSHLVFDGHLLKVFDDSVMLPDGQTAHRELIRHVGAVCVVALTDEGEVLMERQYRYPVAETVFEIPAGKLNGKDEDPREACLRELEEETGAKADRLTFLGTYYPTPAYSDEVIYMYLAESLTFGQCHRDDDEFLAVERVPLETLKNLILEGKVPDGKTQAAVLRAYLIRR